MENRGLVFPTLPVSLYSTMSSSACHEYFPQNLNTSFWNKLPCPIQSQGANLEMALTDVYFTASQQTRKNTIFGHERGDNRIKVVERLLSDHFVNKLEGGIGKFVEHCNIEFKRRGIKIHFNLLIKPDGTQVYVLNLDQMDFNVKMTKEYGEALGFLEPFYSAGRHEADRAPLQELFDKIDIRQKLELVIFKDHDYSVTVEEPVAKTVPDLISSINTALIKTEVVFTWDGILFTFEQEGKGIVFVYLSPFLEKLFGVPPNSAFTGPEMSFPTYSVINLGMTPDFYIITCNAVEPQIYNGRLLPILKMIPFADSKDLRHTSCFPLQYVPLRHDTISNLKIEIFDENLSYSELATASDTTVTIHIRDRV